MKACTSPAVPLSCHHAAAAGSRSVRLHAKPAAKVSHHDACSELHAPTHLISLDPQHLPTSQSDGANPGAAPSQVPQLDLQRLMPCGEMHQPYQQRRHHAQHAHQEVGEAQRAKQQWHDSQPAQQESPQTPQTARSSQSDATHHDYHGNYRSDSTCCDASQSAQADLHQCPALYQLPAADATLLGKDSNAFQHVKLSCQSDASTSAQR